MQAEGAPRQFFFDDDDLSIKFCFQAPEEKHDKDLKMAPILKDTFHLPPSQGEPARNATFALHNKLLVKYKDDAVPDSVLDIAYSRLKLLKPEGENLESGFSVTKNGNSFEFYHADKQIVDNWYDALKKICVLTSFHDDFKAIKMIGRGSFAKVYLVESKENGKSYAVKAFTKDSMNVSNKANAKPSMLNEIGIMREVDHENIIKLYEVYETEKSIYLVLELIQGKSLYDLLKKSNREEVTPTKIINMIRSMLDALSYLAAKGIMHRDLKPDNILLDKGEKVKLVDFGLATFIDVPAYIFKKCGTPGYIAPEVFKYDDKDPNTGYNDKCDAFSVGCLLYYMLFNTPFFGGSTAADILKLNRKYLADFPVLNSIKLELKDPNSKLPKDGLNLLLDLLEFDTKKRASSNQALNHPYFIPCPSGMQKVVGTNEFYVEALTQYSQNEIFSPCSPLKLTPLIQDQVYSPLTPLRVDSFGGESPLLPKKDRFMNQDSLYLDLGKPEINGRTDTITCGSTNNSILLGARVDSSNNIGSTCLPSAFGNRSISRSNSKTYKPHAQGGGSNQNILKLTLLRNMQRNNSEIGREEDSFKSRMDDLKVTRTASESSPQNDESNENIKINIIDGAENENGSQECQETPSNGNPKSRFNVAKLHLVTDRNYGTKPTPSKIKRFQPFAPLSANLPKSQTDNDI